MKMYQQGDVIFELVEPLGEGKETLKTGQRVLVEGETTGHAHKVSEEVDFEQFSLVEKDGVLYLKTKVETPVIHEEHKTITLNPGTYKVRRVREYDHFLEESRNVQD